MNHLGNNLSPYIEKSSYISCFGEILVCGKLQLQQAPAAGNSTSDGRLLHTTTHAIQRAWIGYKHIFLYSQCPRSNVLCILIKTSEFQHQGVVSKYVTFFGVKLFP